MFAYFVRHGPTCGAGSHYQAAVLPGRKYREASLTTDISHYSNWLALALSAGFLAVYFVGAIVSRLTISSRGNTVRSFNLALPSFEPPGELFAISLVSAATTLSTVIVLFLTSSSVYGFHLLICPLTFAVGTMLAIRTYQSIAQHGYMDGSNGSGLLPRFAYSFTESKVVAAVVAATSVLPLVAILVLELRFGVLLLGTVLQQGMSPYGLVAALCFLVMLLGYVYVGGFRAVVTSDIWQYRTMTAGLGIVFLGLLSVGLHSHGLNWFVLAHLTSADPLPHAAGGLQLPGRGLLSFYVTVCVINLFGPMCLATSWQRFYAFHGRAMNVQHAAYSTVRKAITLWGIIIGIGILSQALSAQQRTGRASEDLIQVVSFIQKGPVGAAAAAVWFPYFVFPILILSVFSGMYSSSDTCVSALLYLIESARRQDTAAQSRPPGKKYYLAMAVLFLLSLTIYWVVADPTNNVLGLENIAVQVFGNAALVAPTVLLMSYRRPERSPLQRHFRSIAIITSILMGFVSFWAFYFLRGPFQQWATLAGISGAAVPIGLLVARDALLRKVN